jgi:hypothetical protein
MPIATFLQNILLLLEFIWFIGPKIFLQVSINYGFICPVHFSSAYRTIGKSITTKGFIALNTDKMSTIIFDGFCSKIHAYRTLIILILCDYLRLPALFVRVIS